MKKINRVYFYIAVHCELNHLNHLNHLDNEHSYYKGL